jgi:hypothetical protein
MNTQAARRKPEPWIGSQFKKTRVLILSESIYSWYWGARLCHPPIDHHRRQVEIAINGTGKKRGYFHAMSKVLTALVNSSPEQRQKVWSGYALAPYIPMSIGIGARARPTRAHWHEGSRHFRGLLEKLRPAKIVVTGLTTWNQMPHTQVQRGKFVQAYRLGDGSLVWCLALPHPSNKKDGFKWQQVQRRLQKFLDTDFTPHMTKQQEAGARGEMR